MKNAFTAFANVVLNGRRVSGREVAAAARAQGQSLATALSVANKKASIGLQQWVFRNFQSEGGEVGGWQPLAPGTVAWKAAHGYEQILQNTGRLRNSFLPFADNKKAGVGSAVGYSDPHQLGDGVPQRRMLPDVDEALEVVMPIYGTEVRIATSKRW